VIRWIVWSIVITVANLQVVEGQLFIGAGVRDDLGENKLYYFEISLPNDFGYCEDYFTISKQGDQPIDIQYDLRNSLVTVAYRVVFGGIETNDLPSIEMTVRSLLSFLPTNSKKFFVVEIPSDKGIRRSLEKILIELSNQGKKQVTSQQKTVRLAAEVLDIEKKQTVIHVIVHGNCAVDKIWRVGIKKRYGAKTQINPLPSKSNRKSTGILKKDLIRYLQNKYAHRISKKKSNEDSTNSRSRFTIKNWSSESKN